MTSLTKAPSEPWDSGKLHGKVALHQWLLEGMPESSGKQQGPHGRPAPNHKPHSWWRVMCLTGLDYFSTLGYQPAIAALAAGVLAPLATIVLVLVTLLGALPVYKRVARESPHGAGSIAMLERLLPRWWGKLFVLALLGFAATDFMITITLSAADATAHVIENPFAPDFLHGQNVIITLVLVAALAAVFLRGFKEAIGIAVVLVALFLTLNLVVIAVALTKVVHSPHLTNDWWTALTTQHGNPIMVVAIALLVFPRLALGLSGFETGVAVMPQIKGPATDTDENPEGRIKGAHRLLTTAAVIMSTFLITSSLATTILIPAAEFQPGGEANGRALAFLAHDLLGEGFGTVYDISTIAILWFAGASAMAGLLNLVPRYLPRFGMAPEWAGAVRPLVLVFTAVALFITIIFKADVDAQGGAYATGVLVLITSAAIAVTLSARRKGQKGRTIGFGAISLAFLYTTVANSIERPDGLKIALMFILGIVVVSLLSRIRRSFELRASYIRMDEAAMSFVAAVDEGTIRIISHDPKTRSASAYRRKLAHATQVNAMGDPRCVLFMEVIVDDSSDFETALEVRGITRHGFKILQVHSSNVPNTIAAVLLHIRDATGMIPHIYFRWTEGNPINNLLKYLLIGEGEIAPVTREVLREAEPDLTQRPWVHVG
ncbi:amino acid transporter [Arthrobacter psychrolactophilus]|uniref:Amino acid transporter n=1 Tax=Arthrobacter psychrolactophilus TaxID=92442 RepID=A0A2V5ISN7_9MICC|nr:amino acid transporter [Arthrobacter psychrolactophilus]PYI39535.1 amino acid transporter [Arthrobacter psychrolactophilus]